MFIRSMTPGKKIEYRIENNILYLGDNDEIVIDIEERQKDVEVKIDIYLDDAGILKEGSGKHYVANIIIPPKRYIDVEAEGEDGSGNPITIITKEALSLDINTVTLQLWGIPEKKIEGGNL